MSRILNIALGVTFSVMTMLIAASSLTAWYSFYAFLAAIETLITFTIVVYAWKWPRITVANLAT